MQFVFFILNRLENVRAQCNSRSKFNIKMENQVSIGFDQDSLMVKNVSFFENQNVWSVLWENTISQKNIFSICIWIFYMDIFYLWLSQWVLFLYALLPIFKMPRQIECPSVLRSIIFCKSLPFSFKFMENKNLELC